MPLNYEQIFGDDFIPILQAIEKGLPDQVETMLLGQIDKMMFEVSIFSDNITKTVASLSSSGVSPAQIQNIIGNDMATGGKIFGGFRNSVKEEIVNGMNQASRLGQFEEYGPSDNYVWVTVGGHKICADCDSRAGGEPRPYVSSGKDKVKGWNEIGLPGSGWSLCGGYCYCVLDPVGKIDSKVQAPKEIKPEKAATVRKPPVTSPKMAGKHTSLNDAKNWAIANSKGPNEYLNPFKGNPKRGLRGDFSLYDNFTLKQANILNEKLLEANAICDKLGIPRIAGLIARNPAGAAGSMLNGVMSLTKGTGPGGFAISKRLRDFFKTTIKLTKAGDDIFWHEFGHHIHQQLGNEIRIIRGKSRLYDKTERLLKRRWNSIQRKLYSTAGGMEDIIASEKFREKYIEGLFPTTYSRTNALEWFAENYMFYKNGYGKKLSPLFLEFLEEIGYIDAI